MDYCSGFCCSLCKTQYDIDEVLYTCPKDGGNLDVILDIHCIRQNYRPEDIIISAEPSIWRYLPLLPVDDPGFLDTPLRAVGWTPVYSPPILSEQIGLSNLWIKDESRNPTASFKDRASAVVMAKAMQIGAEIVVTASTGNAGAALAGMAAASGQKAVIFAPKTAPQAKIAQLLIYGATVLLVDGTYDEAFDLSILAAQEFNWYCRNTGYNPFTLEGKKTAAFEIWEYLNRKTRNSQFSTPLNVFVSVGDGNIISGLHKGFKDLLELGWLKETPRLFGVQAEGSAAIANTLINNSEEIIPVSAHTIADSISVDLPRDGIRAVRAIRETSGMPVVVSDAEILSAISALGKSGIFAEPAGAAAYAGLVKAVSKGWILPDDPVLVLNTGNGLKDISAAMKAVNPPPVIEPTLDAVKKVVKL